MPLQQTLTVSVAILRNVGLFGLFFFSLNFISAFYAGQYAPVLFLIFLNLIACYMVVSAGSYQVNDDFISHHCMRDHYQIRWQDVDRIELGGQGG